MALTQLLIFQKFGDLRQACFRLGVSTEQRAMNLDLASPAFTCCSTRLCGFLAFAYNLNTWVVTFAHILSPGPEWWKRAVVPHLSVVNCMRVSGSLPMCVQQWQCGIYAWFDVGSM